MRSEYRKKKETRTWRKGDQRGRRTEERMCWVCPSKSAFYPLSPSSGRLPWKRLTSADFPSGFGGWPLGGTVKRLGGEKRVRLGDYFLGFLLLDCGSFVAMLLYPRPQFLLGVRGCNSFCLFRPKDKKGFSCCPCPFPLILPRSCPMAPSFNSPYSSLISVPCCLCPAGVLTFTVT